MVAENGLGAELVSGCGVVSAWTEDLNACFVWVLNMLDCIILGSMDIGQEGDEEIEVKCRASLPAGGSGVDVMDMTVLLGNCLENAMKAMRSLPVEERRLSVEMVPDRSMILLRVQNTCARSDGSGEPAGWEAFATQRGKDLSSVGLHSITAIAEKYGGSAQFQRQNGVFTTRVILNPKQELRAEDTAPRPPQTGRGEKE